MASPTPTLLLATPRVELVAAVRAADLGLTIEVATPEEALDRWVSGPANCALVDLAHRATSSGACRVLASLREADPGEVRTVMALVSRGWTAGRDAINGGADELVFEPLDAEELRLRLALAQRRAARISGELAVRQYATAAMDRVLDALPVVLVQAQTDDQGRYRVRFEPEAFARLGLDIAVPNTVPAAELLERVGSLDRARVASSLREARQRGQPWSEAFALVDRQGRSRLVRVFATPSERDAAGVTTWNALVLDVSQQRELEHRIECASAALRAKRAFLSTASHELRTPLTAIIGLSQLLARALPADAGPLAREALVMIEESGGQLLRMVEDVLELSDLGAPDAELHSQVVDLRALTARAVEGALPRAAEAGLRLATLSSGSPVCVEGDALRLTRAFIGLLDNAIKFTPAGGEIAIHLAAEDTTERVVLGIRDSGIGISAGRARELLVPLTQLDDGLNRRYGGMGLGLALAARVAALHGGCLRLDSTGRPGEGAAVALILPLAGSCPPSRAFPGARVVIAADCPRSLADSCLALGAQAHLAHDAPAAEELFRGPRPDLVVLGHPFGGSDAAALLQRWAALPALHGVPLVVACSLLLPGDRQRLAPATVLTRPIGPAMFGRLLAPHPVPA